MTFIWWFSNAYVQNSKDFKLELVINEQGVLKTWLSLNNDQIVYNFYNVLITSVIGKLLTLIYLMWCQRSSLLVISIINSRSIIFESLNVNTQFDE